MRTERVAWSTNGLITVGVIILLFYLIILNIFETELWFVGLFTVLVLILLAGLTIVKPNEAKVILLFGKYLGTIRQEGLIYTVPFTKRKRMSLKIKTSSTNYTIHLPKRALSIQLIVFYKVVDTAKVLFEVEQFESFIQLQSEIILKSLLLDYEPITDNYNEIVSVEFKEHLRSLLEQKFNRLGIDIVDVHIID